MAMTATQIRALIDSGQEVPIKDWNKLPKGTRTELNKFKEQKNTQGLQSGALPGKEFFNRTADELKAGVAPLSYSGTRDVTTGQLLDQYKLDPYAGEATQALKQQAFAQGTSPWAQLQLDKQAFEQQNLSDQAIKQQAQGQSMATSNLARVGGLGGGARNRVAMQGAKDLMIQQQGISRGGMADRLNIGEQDLNRKQELLGNFASQEGQAQQANIGQSVSDLNRRALFDANRYASQTGQYGAGKTAAMQAQAGSGGGKK